jgi:hypothetical protein
MVAYLSPPLPKRSPFRSQRAKSKEPSLDEILEDICAVFKQNVIMVKSTRKCRKYVICRRIYNYVSHVLTNQSITEIASLINRDHSSCLTLLRQSFDCFEINDPSFTGEWGAYISKSIIWWDYFFIKKAA